MITEASEISRCKYRAFGMF